jgi:hypothetical protein
MRRLAALLIMVVQGAFCVAVAQTAPAGVHHDRAYWQAIIASDYKAPAGADLPQLASELSALLGSEDPTLRDGTAYNILTAWMYTKRQLDDASVRVLMAGWLKNIATVGPTPNSVLLRSFSALMLSVAIARDNAQPYLDEKQFREVWNGALKYLESETDLRGYDPRIGWLHSAAHTADLLKFLARSRYVTPDDQAALLNAIGRKLSTAPIVFTFGEDERYARAVLSIIRRKDFDADGFAKSVAPLRAEFPKEELPDPQVFRKNQNLKNSLAKLAFLLALEPEPSSGVASARTAVAATLKDTF